MANLLFAPENLTRSGLETPEGVSLHAGWYKSAPQQSLWTAWTSLARPTPPTGQQQHQSGHLMCYEGRTSSRALDTLAVYLRREATLLRMACPAWRGRPAPTRRSGRRASPNLRTSSRLLRH